SEPANIPFPIRQLTRLTFMCVSYRHTCIPTGEQAPPSKPSAPPKWLERALDCISKPCHTPGNQRNNTITAHIHTRPSLRYSMRSQGALCYTTNLIWLEVPRCRGKFFQNPFSYFLASAIFQGYVL